MRSVLVLCLVLTYILLACSKKTYYDIPPSHIPSDLSLQTVILFGRHGNRSPNPIVRQLLCVAPRSKLEELYLQQNSVDGALTINGVRAMRDLGTFFHRQYISSGFLPPIYQKQLSQLRAAAADRTLVSASAFGQTAFPRPYAGDLSIPPGVVSLPSDTDNMLEVRKAKCAWRLDADLAMFDHYVAPAILNRYKPLLDKISTACEFDLLHTPSKTNNVFSVLQAVKDMADALTGDLLEDFPLLTGLTPAERDEFLQFAEDVFNLRHYHATPEQVAYLTGNTPNRVIKLFDRRVSYNVNMTVLEDHYQYTHNSIKQYQQTRAALRKSSQQKEDGVSTAAAAPPLGQALPHSDGEALIYKDIIQSTTLASPLQMTRPPRRFFGYYCHREILYALSKFLRLDIGVHRDALPDGLVHPGIGLFLELFQNTTRLHETLLDSHFHGHFPVLPTERNNSQRYLHNPVDSAYFVRFLVWVPCFDGMDSDSRNVSGAAVTYRKELVDGQMLCNARVRTLPQCDHLEFCPLDRIKSIIAANFNQVGGDYRSHCRSPRNPPKMVPNQVLDSLFADLDAAISTQASQVPNPVPTASTPSAAAPASDGDNGVDVGINDLHADFDTIQDPYLHSILQYLASKPPQTQILNPEAKRRIFQSHVQKTPIQMSTNDHETIHHIKHVYDDISALDDERAEDRRDEEEEDTKGMQGWTLPSGFFASTQQKQHTAQSEEDPHHGTSPDTPWLSRLAKNIP